MIIDIKFKFMGENRQINGRRSALRLRINTLDWFAHGSASPISKAKKQQTQNAEEFGRGLDTG